MLHLVGIDHSVQHDGRAGYIGPEFDRLRQQFEESLRQLAQQVGAKVLAEESNPEVLDRFSATRSIAMSVAKELGIRHLFCEPSIAERKRLGIVRTGSPTDFEKREQFWLEKLKPYKEEPVLFILGADHISSFSEYARSAGLLVGVAEEYFGRRYFAR